MFEAIAELLKSIIPNKNNPPLVWAFQWAFILAIFYAIAVPVWWAFRDSEIAARHGFRTATPDFSARDVVRSQKNLFESLTSLNDENAAIDGTFLFLGFNKTGLEYLDSTDSVELAQWAAPGLRFTGKVREIWHFNRGAYQGKLSNRSSCFVEQIYASDRRRLIAAIPGNDSDRVAICPLTNKNRAFGIVAIIWTAPKTNPTELDQSITQSANSYRSAISEYLRSQPGLAIKN